MQGSLARLARAQLLCELFGKRSSGAAFPASTPRPQGPRRHGLAMVHKQRCGLLALEVMIIA